MKSIEQFIFESSGKPSDLKKYKKIERKETVHFRGSDMFDTNDPGYDDEFTYYSGEGNGYIKDKAGHVYDVITSDRTGDAGAIAGGSHDYYVTIKKANGTDDFFVHGYTAVFSSSHYAGCIADIKAGYYLEDYIAKYGGDRVSQFKDIAAKGDKDAKPYDQQKKEKLEQKKVDFYERYVVLPENIYYEISEGELEFVWWRLEPKVKDKIRKERDEWLKKTGHNGWDNELKEDPNYQEFTNKLKDAQDKFNDLLFSVLKPVLIARIQEVFKTKDLSKLNGIAGSFFYKQQFSRGKKGEYGNKAIAIDTKKKQFAIIHTADNKVLDDNIELQMSDTITFKKSKASQEMLDLCQAVAKAWKKTEGKKQTEYVNTHWEQIWQGGRGIYPWNPDKYTKGQAKQMAKEEFIKMVNDHDFDRKDQLVFSLELIKGYVVGDLNPEEEPVEKPLENPEPSAEKKEKKMSGKAKTEAYDKMKAWHEGTRKQNLKGCSDAKLKMNYQVCKELGYEEEMKKIEDEANSRNLQLESMITIEEYIKIYENNDDEEIS